MSAVSPSSPYIPPQPELDSFEKFRAVFDPMLALIRNPETHTIPKHRMKDGIEVGFFEFENNYWHFSFRPECYDALRADIQTQAKDTSPEKLRARCLGVWVEFLHTNSASYQNLLDRTVVELETKAQKSELEQKFLGHMYNRQAVLATTEQRKLELLKKAQSFKCAGAYLSEFEILEKQNNEITLKRRRELLACALALHSGLAFKRAARPRPNFRQLNDEQRAEILNYAIRLGHQDAYCSLRILYAGKKDSVAVVRLFESQLPYTAYSRDQSHHEFFEQDYANYSVSNFPVTSAQYAKGIKLFESLIDRKLTAPTHAYATLLWDGKSMPIDRGYAMRLFYKSIRHGATVTLRPDVHAFFKDYTLFDEAYYYYLLQKDEEFFIKMLEKGKLIAPFTREVLLDFTVRNPHQSLENKYKTLKLIFEKYPDLDTNLLTLDGQNQVGELIAKGSMAFAGQAKVQDHESLLLLCKIPDYSPSRFYYLGMFCDLYFAQCINEACQKYKTANPESNVNSDDFKAGIAYAQIKSDALAEIEGEIDELLNFKKHLFKRGILLQDPVLLKDYENYCKMNRERKTMRSEFLKLQAQKIESVPVVTSSSTFSGQNLNA